MSSDTALSPWATRFVARKAMFTFLGASFRLFGPEGNLRFFVQQKAFRLKEELVVYGDEAKTRPMLRIQARSILDGSATYDVSDAQTGEVVGALRRKGLRSILRDEWDILGPGGEPVIGRVQEDSGPLALLRRFLLPVIPQTFHVRVGEADAGVVKQRFHLFALIYDVDLSASVGRLDPRLGVAMVVLLLAVEGRQQ